MNQIWLGSLDSYRDYLTRQDRLDSAVASGMPAPAQVEGYSLHGNVAVVDVSGPLTNTDSFWNELFGLTSYNSIRNNLIEAASNPDVKEIVMNIDSPGGSPAGLSDVSNLIQSISKAIPVSAYTAGHMTSAAYWLGSAADKIYAGPTATVGSIGVITTHFDVTKNLEDKGVKPTVIRAGDKKALGGPYEELSKEAKAEIQGQLDHLHDVFISKVADHRGMSHADVKKNLADGSTFIGEQAVSVGLADGLTTLDALVGGLQTRYESKSTRGTDAMATRKKLLSEREVALIAEGVTPQAAFESAPADETPPATPPEGETPPAPATTDETPPAAAASAAAPAAATPDLVTFLQADLAAKATEITQLSVKLAEQERELNAFKAHDSELKAIVAASVNRMQIGLGGKSTDLSKLSTEALLSQHSSVMTQFSQTFPVGGVAAVSTEEEGAPKAASNSPLDKARMRVVKTHK
jgi:signal peptide peptidase SppA